MNPRKRTPVHSVLVGTALFFLFLGSGPAQFLPTETAGNAAWEEFLKSAKITGSEQLGGPDATTRPQKLALEKAGQARFGLWKNIDSTEGGVVDTWRFEIAAYRLDKLLDLGMIPPTVERRVAGEKGSLQLWIDNTASLKRRTGGGTGVPADKMPAWNRMAFLQRAFDCLIANEDRNANNILVTEDWRMLLIDHSRSFRTKKPYTERLVFGAGGLLRAPEGNPYPLAPLPKAFFEKLKALEAGAVREAVRPYLTKPEIDAGLARRDLIVREVEDLIRRDGEDKVLYDPPKEERT
jgi:hypothetical protein